MFGVLDMVPADGEQDIDLQFKDLQIHISRIEEHQIACARIHLLPHIEKVEEEEE